MTRARALLFILLVCGAGILATASPALAAKSQPCWKQVINDWSQDGSIDGAYSAKCIEEALDRSHDGRGDGGRRGGRAAGRGP